MKAANLVVLLILITVVGISAQRLSKSQTNSQIPGLSSTGKNEHFSSIDFEARTSNSYLEKGITYLGIAAILVLIWTFLHYKV